MFFLERDINYSYREFKIEWHITKD
jgi:hypothetical protein